jgi:hypothetical protein
MKRDKLMKLALAVILAIGAGVPLHASAQSKTSQQGTILNVDKQEVASPFVRAGADAVHTPLQSHYYVYNVSVQLKCDVYVGSYQSELDDLPATLSPNNSVAVHLQKKTLYFDLPEGPLKMETVHHTVSHDGTCE